MHIILGYNKFTLLTKLMTFIPFHVEKKEYQISMVGKIDTEQKERDRSEVREIRKIEIERKKRERYSTRRRKYNKTTKSISQIN